MLFIILLVTGYFNAQLAANTEVAFNLEHTSLGQAVLFAGSSELTVLNIGPSGLDGTSVTLLGGPVTWSMTMLDPLGPGAFMDINSTGTVNDVPGQPLCVLHMANLVPIVNIGLDFAGVDANTITVDYILDGAQVLRENYEDTNNIMIVAPDPPQTWLEELLRFFGLCRVTLGWNGLPGGTTVETPQGNMVTVTEVRIVGRNVPVSMDGFSRVDITTSGIALFTIVDEWTELSRASLWIPGDFNRDRYVNIDDLAAVCGVWLECDQPSEPLCTWSAQTEPEWPDRDLMAGLSEMGHLYTAGMTRQEFFDENFPGTDEIAAPDWMHKVADILWEILGGPPM